MVGAFVVKYEGEIIHQDGAMLPEHVTTSNQAEHYALNLALKYAKEQGWTHQTFYGDSQIAVQQASGRWKIHADGLKKIGTKNLNRVKEGKLQVVWIPRELTKDADAQVLATVMHHHRDL